MDSNQGTLTLTQNPVNRLNLPGQTRVFLVKNAGLTEQGGNGR